jgi:succinate dehydrogenase / fumarate reductase, flavoprotein subunit
MYRQFLETQMLDISREPMEVAPTSHYSMGGVVVEPETHATDVAGLYAAGEVTAGLHGANRLGGNSLSETVIFGRRAGEAAAAFSRATELQPRSRQKIQAASDEIHSYIKEGEEFARPLQRALRNAMWEGCGVVRAEEGLREALTKLDEIKKAAGDVDVRPDSEGYGDLAHALDLRASLVTAEASLLGATQRRESRGAHQRSDHPHLDPSMKMNLAISKNPDGRLHVSREPVPPVPDYLRAWAEGDDEVEVAGRLLE